MVRPGLIFCALYTWNASTGGRFVAPYLRRSLPDSSSIGTILACQMVITSLLGGSGGKLADEWERKNPFHGRLNVMRVGIFLGMFLSVLEGVGNRVIARSKVFDMDIFGGSILFWWNLLLRSGYAISVVLTGPVIDGLVLSHLKNEGNHSTEGYGKERLHGAIWWGISNIIIGIACDQLGFDVALLLMIMVTSSVCFLTLSIYEAGFSNSAEITQDAIHEQSLLLTEESESPDEDGSSSESCNKIANAIDVKEVATEQTLWRLFRLVMSTPRRAAFFLSFFLLNVGMAVVENLIFLFYASTLGSSQTMCGLSVVSTILLEIPIFYASPWFLKTIGPEILLSLACLAYILRTIGYIFVPHMGIIVLSLDLLHGISYACSQTAGVEFVARIIPDSYEASGQGILLLIRGLGATLGLLTGGMVEDALGGRGLYAFLCGTVTFGFLILSLTSCFSGQRPEPTNRMDDNS